MVRRAVLVALAGAVALLALAPVAGAQDESTPRIQTFELQPKEFYDPATGPLQNWGRDTVITEHAPDENYKNERFLNTSAAPGKTSMITLRFPLDQPRKADPGGGNPPGPLPANVSMGSPGTEADLILYYRDAMPSDERGRTLDVYTLQGPWDEGSLDWNEFKSRSGFVSSTRIARSPQQEGLQALSRDWDVTGYMSEVLTPRNPEPFDGFLIRDATLDDSNCHDSTVACVQEFYSSNWINRDGNPKSCDAVASTDTCLPKMILDVRMNTPHVHNITYAGGDGETHVAPGTYLNISADVWDPVGELRKVRMSVRTEDGEKVLEQGIFENRSRNVTGDRPDIASSFKVWRNATVDLPAGRYTLNMSVQDTDGRWTNTSFLETNFTVDATPPSVPATEVSTRQANTGDTVSFSLNASDLYGIERAWAVLDNPARPPVRTDYFTAAGVSETSGNGTYTGQYKFGFPGTYNLSFKVEDRPGNVASVSPCPGDPCTIEVEDNQDPTIIASCFRLGAVCVSDDQAQEIGGSLTFELEAKDNHPKPVDARLVLTHQSTFARKTVDDLRKVGDRTWRYEATFEEGEWRTGQWEAQWVVTDPDGNTERTPVNLTFRLEPAGPPTLTDFEPDGWGPAQPQLRAVLQDVNIDRHRITLFVSVNGQDFQRVQSAVTSVGDEATATAKLGPFIHGDQVEVKVVATDTFNRTLRTVRSFTVDDREPRADLAFQGRAIEGLARKVIPASTHLLVQGNDTDSGLAFTQFRVFPRDGTAGAWQRADGPVNVTTAPGYEGPGAYSFQYRAVDAAGNPGDPSSADVYVDVRAPTIDWSRTADAVELAVEDPGSGVRDVRVHYRNSSGPFLDLPVTLVQKTPDGGVYRADLPFTPRGERIQVWFAAEDALNHTATLGRPDTSGQRPLGWDQPNHPPAVEIQSPTPRSQVSGEVPVRWSASDPDGDDVEVEVEARPVVLDEARPVADPLGNPGNATWDTTSFPDGRYELRVVARDGRNTTVGTTIVDIRNTELGLAEVSVPSGDLDPGESATISATVYRKVKTVKARIQLAAAGGGETVETVTLRDDGRGADAAAGDGTHTGTFTPTREGSYSTALQITYEDGSTEETGDVGTFTAQTTLAEQLEAKQDVVAAAGAVLVVLAAATVIQLYRYGYI